MREKEKEKGRKWEKEREFRSTF